ncbi:Hypothetical predicted protein [Podarcis lilfordi]|uniref:Uncharacterized protein n=1 Tax=Podarcis lilfordi TaxID=74358 RepID=A0AA35JPW1_9SAUR|nr:Hypothetical predicted protein [Podarcis lilfordi]
MEVDGSVLKQNNQSYLGWGAGIPKATSNSLSQLATTKSQRLKQKLKLGKHGTLVPKKNVFIEVIIKILGNFGNV